MKKILITGGAGFIGSNLTNKLIKLKYDITILDNLNSQIHGKNPEKDSYLFNSIKNKVKFIKGCVTNKKVLLKALKYQDLIIHLAAETGTGQSMYEIEKYNNINVGGTALLLDILCNHKHQVKKIIVASSRAIYGEGKYWSKTYNKFVYPPNRTINDLINKDFEVKFGNKKNILKLVATDEKSIIHPNSVYGITKQVQEQLIMTVCPTLNIQPVALRYQNVYGPGQSLHNPYTGILSIFSNLILNNKDINIFEDGLESRDFIYIEDVVNATIECIKNSKANGEIFNIGFGKPITVLTVAKTLMKLYNKNVPMKISGNFRVGDIRHNYADISKLKKILLFKPQTDFKTGIKHFVEWVSNQHLINNNFDKSLKELSSKGLLK